MGATLTSKLLTAVTNWSLVAPGSAVNLHASISFAPTMKGIEFAIRAPVRGESLRTTIVSAESCPVLYRVLSGACNSSTLEESGVKDTLVANLEQAAVLLPSTKMPSEVRFSAPLSQDDVVTNVWVQRPDEAQQSVPASLKECARLDGDWLAWVHDPDRNMDWPYWVTPEQAEALSARSSRPESSTVSMAWERALSEARQQLATQGCAILRSIIPEGYLKHIQAYYRDITANGYLAFGDSTALRYNLHNEALTRWLHFHTEPLVTRAMPEPVRCSYAYLGFYLAGAILKRHIDREQSVYALSLTIDATPSHAPEDAWPLYADLADGSRVEALLAPGDGLIFKGCELPHYRDELPAGRSSSSLFFFYVPAEFTGSLD